MSPPVARSLVVLAVLVTVGLEVATIALVAGVGRLEQPVLYAGYAIVQAVAGAIVLWRYPRHRVGWLLVCFALAGALLGDAALSYGQRGAAEGWSGAAQAEVVGLTSWVLGALGLALLFLLFPDGRYLSPGWRWVPALWLAGAALAVPGWALNPRLAGDLSAGVNPLATDRFPAEPAFAIGTTLLSVAMVASVAALIVRFRRSDNERRQQLKWVLFAAAIIIVVLPVSAALWTAWPPIRYAPAVGLPLLPIAVCVAIVRQHLYDIDLVISRTVAYGAITIALAAAYAATVIAVGLIVASPVAAAAGALVVAVGFWPVRTWTQDAVDRRFRRSRYESLRQVGEFVDRLRRGQVEVVALEDALRAAVHDEELSLAFASGSTTLDIGGHPQELTAGGDRQITAVDTGHRLVTLIRHRSVDAQLVGAVVDAGRLAVEIASLHVELHRRLEELDGSRARIVAVAEEERRRLARDLHDGAQQRLVSIGLGLRHVQHSLDGSAPAEVDRTLDGAVAELSNAIDELRELASGLRPPSLDDGLAAAFAELATRSPVPVELQTVRDRFGAEVEAAAYFIACEGLTNAVKHASARRVVLGLERRGDQLVLDVADDGGGGADVRRGTGLLGLIDRAQAHGGSLTITSSPDSGTRLTARLPCG